MLDYKKQNPKDIQALIDIKQFKVDLMESDKNAPPFISGHIKKQKESIERLKTVLKKIQNQH